eukprot:8987583-Alexandrium_andersonii.AAC.1
MFKLPCSTVELSYCAGPAREPSLHAQIVRPMLIHFASSPFPLAVRQVPELAEAEEYHVYIEETDLESKRKNNEEGA